MLLLIPDGIGLVLVKNPIGIYFLLVDISHGT